MDFTWVAISSTQAAMVAPGGMPRDASKPGLVVGSLQRLKENIAGSSA